MGADRGRRTEGDEQTGDANDGGKGWKIQSSRETDRQAGGWAGRQARDSSPEWSRHRIRAASPPCLGLLHGDNTQYESFMRWGWGGGGLY